MVWSGDMHGYSSVVHVHALHIIKIWLLCPEIISCYVYTNVCTYILCSTSCMHLPLRIFTQHQLQILPQIRFTETCKYHWMGCHMNAVESHMMSMKMRWIVLQYVVTLQLLTPSVMPLPSPPYPPLLVEVYRCTCTCICTCNVHACTIWCMYNVHI